MNRLLLLLFLAQVRYSVDTSLCGTIDPVTGLYTAPATVAAAVDCPVTATSTTDSTKFDRAVVTLVADAIPPPPPPPSVNTAGFVYPLGFPRDCDGPFGVGFPSGVLPRCKVAEIPLASFPIPAAGGSYTDANFGHEIKVLARDAAHGYSNPSAFTATRKYALLWISVMQRAEVVEVATTRIIAPGTRPRPGSELRTHPTDDDIYYFSGIGEDQQKIKRHHISTGVTEVVMDIAQWFRGAVRAVTLIPHGPTAVKPGQGLQFKGVAELGPAPEIRDGGAGNITVDGLFGFWVPEVNQACVADLFKGRLYCRSYAEYNVSNIQGVMVSHGVSPENGKRYAFLAAAPAAVFFTVNETLGKLDFSFLGPDAPPDAGRGDGDTVCEAGEECFNFPHGDIGHDAQGRQFFIGGSGRADPCGSELVKYPLASEGRMWIERQSVARMLACGGDKWVNLHAGCSVNAPVCTISTDYELLRADTDLTTPIERGNYTAEIWALKFGVDSTEIRRLAQHRSVQWVGDQYYSRPRACPSPDGKSALWTSNFGYPPDAAGLKFNVASAATGF